MCGILGAIDFDKGIEKLYPSLQKGLRKIGHRGPDGTKDLELPNCYLGHNRLRIIDLTSNADQPMKSGSSNAYIIFNGEIYNYKDLKKEISDVKFYTNSDTEVLLEGYLKYGFNFFKRLRGIFAFAIFDFRERNKIILGRDPAGVNPLYFFSQKKFYIFASEMKAMLPVIGNELSLNENVLKCYLNLGYCPEPNTIYSEIKTVEPGYFYEITQDGVKKNNFAEYNFEIENRFSFNQNKEYTESLLRTAVGRNLVSDVEVAVALSGGIDSSLVYAYANEMNSNIQGITVRFDDEEYNEEAIAKLYSDSLKGNLKIIDVNAELNLEILNKILCNFDQPYADSSAINVYYLTKATKEFTKVLIGGDGGDELYNGYPSQTWLTFLQRFNRNRISRKGGNALLDLMRTISNPSKKRLIQRFIDLWSDEPAELLYDWHSWFPRKTLFENKSPFLFDTGDGMKLYQTIFINDAPYEFKNFVVFDYFRKTMLSDYLRKTEMMSMINGVEYRVPFLDEDLVSFALTIPFGQKSTLRETKKMLREIHKNKYPAETSKIPKKGFTIPLDSALSRDEFFAVKENILSDKSLVTDYIRKDYVEFLFKALQDRNSVQQDISRAGIYQRILMLYSLSLWSTTKSV